MNDDELDARLRAADPSSRAPHGLAAQRIAVLERARGRRRRGRIGITAAVASALLLGGGGVALAGGDHLSPWGWVGDNSFTIERPAGGNCFIGMRVMLHGISADDPIAVDAREILSSLDLESLDITATLEESRAYNDAAPAEAVQSEDEMRMQAMAQVAAHLTFDELNALGHEMTAGHEISIASDSTECR